MARCWFLGAILCLAVASFVDAEGQQGDVSRVAIDGDGHQHGLKRSHSDGEESSRAHRSLKHHRHRSHHHEAHAAKAAEEVTTHEPPAATEQAPAKMGQLFADGASAEQEPPRPAANVLVRSEPKVVEPEVSELTVQVSNDKVDEEEIKPNHALVAKIDESLLDFLHSNEDDKDTDARPLFAPSNNKTGEDSDGDMEYRAFPEMPADNLCPETLCRADDDCNTHSNFGCRCQKTLDKRGCWHCRCSHGRRGCHPHSSAVMCAR